MGRGVFFTLSQVAGLTDTSIEVLRVYQGIGLLQPPWRLPGRSGERAYRTEHLERVRFIRRAVSLGFSFQDIAKIVEGGKGLRTCRDVYDIGIETRDRLRTTGREPSPQLEYLVARCPRAGSWRDCPILAYLSHGI
jgi:DNA-binding transcriptional MerR regulator